MNQKVFLSLNEVLFQFHKRNDYRFINDIFDTFGLNYHNYKSVKYDIDIENFILFDRDNKKLLFEHIPAKAFYYDVAMDIISCNDFNEKISKVAAKYVKENHTFNVRVEKRISLEDSIYVLANINNSEVMNELAYTRILDSKTLSEEIISELKLENDKMIVKYIQRQKEKIYLYIFNSDGFDESKLYNIIANLVKQADSDCVANLFGYVFYEDDLEYISSNIDAIKNITETEIKKFLLFKIGEAEFNDNPLTKSTMIIRGGLEESEIQSFLYRIRQSCEEYFLLREISNVQRKQVIEEIFEKSAIKESSVISSNEVLQLRKEKENLFSVNSQLTHKIESLSKEVELLKKTLSNKDKEFEGVLREKQAEYSKELKEKEVFIEFTKEEIVRWANWWFLKSATPETENDTEVKQYDITELQQKRLLIVGGRSERINKLRELLPKSVFITSETDKIPTGDFDLVFFFNNFMNHSMYEKCVRKAREQKINMGYTLCTNIEKTLSDIYEGMKGSKVLTFP